jgi:GDP-L-fucose synthase
MIQEKSFVPLPLDAKIFIAGHRGLVGSSLIRLLQKRGFTNLLTRGKSQLDLRNQYEVDQFFAQEKPEYVFLAAAKVGGIRANSQYPADFIFDNLRIATNVISAAHRYEARKLLNLGSSCIYPKFAPQPIPESSLLTGELEPTNRAYAVAKIAAIEMCDALRVQHGCNFISAMPTNLYGPGDNFDLQSSHVLPALIRKAHEAKVASAEKFDVWGSGKALREFLYVDDLAEACFFLMENWNGSGPINVGVGEDISIRELAFLVRDIVGFEGDIAFDATQPDGTPRKLLDVSRVQNLGWSASTDLRTGIGLTYNWMLSEMGLPAKIELP